MSAAFYGYLTAFAYLWTLFMGALFWIMLAHLTRALWFVPLRRLTESVTSFWPVLFVGFSPWLFTRPAPLCVRSLLYLLTCAALATLLRRFSLSQDRNGPEADARRMRRLSAVGLPLWVVAVTFGSFDWLMAIDVGHSSTIYGVYVFAGTASSSLALVALLALGSRTRKPWSLPLGQAHVLALGKLLLTFVCFWAYIAFCQLLLIWITDLPREAPFYARRLSGPFGALSVVLVVLHFLLPFFGLLWRWAKLHLGYVAFWAAVLLIAHFVDVCWLVLPGSGVGLLGMVTGALALAGWGSLCAALALSLARREAKVAAHDPLLPRSLELEPS